MKIAITAESTIDLTKELLKKYDIKTLPFTVILGDNEFKDGEITSKDILNISFLCVYYNIKLHFCQINNTLI